MRRLKAGTMKLLKKSIITFVASCVLAVGAMAFEPQKGNDKPPPPKQPRDVRQPPKETPPPRDNNNNGNKGNNDGKRGGKP
jgi:hypothetical protein